MSNLPNRTRPLMFGAFKREKNIEASIILRFLHRFSVTVEKSHTSKRLLVHARILVFSYPISIACLDCRITGPIASRCAKFRFRPLTREIMVARLGDIAKKEGFNLDDDVRLVCICLCIMYVFMYVYPYFLSIVTESYYTMYVHVLYMYVHAYYACMHA